MSRSSQTRVLSIHEILLDIFRYIYDDDDLERPKRRLLRVALTCRNFSGPALDILWREVAHLEDLLRVLPLTRDSASLDLIQALTKDDWACFKAYARRIRRLGGNDGMCSRFHPPAHVYSLIQHEIATHELEGVLFKILRVLDIDIHFLAPSLELLLCLKAPMVHTIKLRLSMSASMFDDTFVRAFLESLHESYPLLEHLLIECHLGHCSYPALLAKQKKLTTLDLTGVTGLDHLALLVHISTLKHLTSLKMPQYPIHRVDGQEPLLGNFPSLREICLSAQMQENLQILSLLPAHNLKSISITRDTRWDPDASVEATTKEWQTFFQDLATSVPTLESLVVADSVKGLSFGLDASILEPLCRLKNLRILDMGTFGATVYDQIVIQLTSAWPEIEVLKFPTQGTHDTVLCTFAALRHIAQYCPKLRELSMSLDPNHLPDEGAWIGGSVQSFYPTCMSDIASTTDVELVAYHLLQTFPLLEEVYQHGCSWYPAYWRDVDRIIKGIPRVEPQLGWDAVQNGWDAAQNGWDAAQNGWDATQNGWGATQDDWVQDF